MNKELLPASLPRAVSWQEGEMFMLDQTRLPLETVIEKMETVEDVWQGIKVLKVRGAPAIGIAAAYGLCVALKPYRAQPLDLFMRELEKSSDYLDSARPTAVNLGWALRRMKNFASRMIDGAENSAALYDLLVAEAIRIHEEDKALCRGMGENGAPLIKEGMGVLTHCNAGSLATSELGTATAPMYVAHAAGVKFRVYADETRPLLQGARLTSWELQQAGIDVTLNTDNMVAHLMAQGLIDLVIVGTDRVAANGDVANKIGTLGVAILAQHFGIPFYVACPSSTIDFDTMSGTDIPIEQRESEEVTEFGMRRTAPEAVKVANPAFDVTPADLVTGIITEKGIAVAPYASSLRNLFPKEAAE
ncbi:S-methyl-5-thioribose-1-phosphate isomerase [Sneathiella sp. P13V-1]|uniref:S-methyl-5-thioribose-1-phosphate isomerase n=1 Tax=Sneathiella sp. P13V-1 TaxID=2697366 RepID=UPI00187B711B|nr:S-methyl-5-thioribose-1-phosphate isomerase [Sneathiella sp. P13V-1]MBE7638646.1 S-methyl-5-thioribose-1-phosphate isomerase [Sneathiella sp. P13V-1]